MVKEFYANMVGTKDKVVYVRGRWVSFSREQINKTFNFRERKDEYKFKRLVEAPNFQNIVDLLTDGKGKWNATRKNPQESIARGALTEQAKVWFYFLSLVILPSKHLCTIREKEAVLLYAILNGYKFSVGKLIENSILSYYKGGYKGLIPHPRLISRLCILGGVQGDWEEEENCPKTSPLTLIGVTKGPKIKGRESHVEDVQEEEELTKLQQLQLEDETLKLPQRQRSASPVLPFSLEVRPVHQEHAEGFEPLRNNSAILEMLNAMKQGMKERDTQLKLQLQLIDKYIEAELRRRDQNLEEALKQRDEEWKSKWE